MTDIERLEYRVSVLETRLLQLQYEIAMLRQQQLVYVPYPVPQPITPWPQWPYPYITYTSGGSHD